MTVYDAFLFNSELEMLELRLHTLGPVVKTFVLRDMRPTLTLNDASYNSLRDTKLSTDISLSNTLDSQAPDNGDVGLSQLSHSMSTTYLVLWPRIIAPLRLHICHVLSMGAKEKMIRVNTGRIVTPMTYFKSVWDRTIRQFPNDAMREGCRTVDSELPIAVRVFRSNPNPAPIRFRHLRPEFGFKRYSPCLLGALRRAVSVTIPLCFRGANLDDGSAGRTWIESADGASSIDARARAVLSLPTYEVICSGLKFLTTMGADTGNRDIFLGHWTLLSSGAMPRAVCAAPGLLHALNCTISRVYMRKLEAAV